MLRPSLLFGALMSLTLVAANGCQSCSSCHDYDPPVANCQCGPTVQSCNSGGCSNCGCNGGYGASNQPTENMYTESTEPNSVTPVAGRVVTPQTVSR